MRQLRNRGQRLAVRATQVRRAPCRDARSVRKAGAAGADGAASELRPLPATGGAAAETTASRRKRKRRQRRASRLWRRSGAWKAEAQLGRRRDSALVGRSRRLGGVDRGRPASEQVERLLGAGAGFGGVGEERQPVVGGDVEAVEAEAELADDGVVEVLDGGGVEADVVCGPVGAERARSGSRARRRGLRGRGRAGRGRRPSAGSRRSRGRRGPSRCRTFRRAGRGRRSGRGSAAGSGAAYSSENSARPSWLVARMSRRSLPTYAAAPVIASSVHWISGRMRGLAGRRRGRAPAGWAARARSKRWARSASSSWSARASASSTLSETPLMSPRSRRV